MSSLTCSKYLYDWKNPYMSKDLLLVVKNFELKLNESSSRTISEFEYPMLSLLTDCILKYSKSKWF